MRVALLWFMLTISVGLFVQMLLALRNYRAHNTVRTHAKAAVEYGWAIVPWLILALSAAPAVQRILAAG
jgi:heme/copper-type cytochrome/quinol oxidase subunit 2